MLTVADIAAEDAGAALPPHLITRPPNRCDPIRYRGSAP
jgi:hypothetical protein